MFAARIRTNNFFKSALLYYYCDYSYTHLKNNLCKPFLPVLLFRKDHLQANIFKTRIHYEILSTIIPNFLLLFIIHIFVYLSASNLMIFIIDWHHKLVVITLSKVDHFFGDKC